MHTRIIRPIPEGIMQPPAGAVILDGKFFDYIVTDGNVPDDAIYVATQGHAANMPTDESISNPEESAEVSVTNVVKDETDGVLTSRHTFSGWPLPEGPENSPLPEFIPPA